MYLSLKQVSAHNQILVDLGKVETHDAQYTLGSFLPVTELLKLSVTPLIKETASEKREMTTTLENIFMPIFSEITVLGALAPQQFVGMGETTKRVIDYRSMVAVRTKLEQISKEYPINFVISAGEGARDESFGLAHGDVIFSHNHNEDFIPENFPKFVERLSKLGYDINQFKGLKPYTVEINVDVVDGTTFTSKGAPRGTSMITLGFLTGNIKKALRSVPDEMTSIVRAVARGLKGVNTSHLVKVKDFVKQVAEAKLKRDHELEAVSASHSHWGADDLHHHLYQRELEIAKQNLKVSMLNRPQNKALVELYAEAGVKVDRDAEGKIVWTKSKTKGKEYNLVSGNISLVGDGNIVCILESDIFDGRSGATEGITIAHMAEQASYLLLSPKAVKAHENNIHGLILKILKHQGQFTTKELDHLYGDDLQKLAKLGYVDQKDFVKEWSKEELIMSDTVMTFISAITPMEGEYGVRVSGKSNHEAYPGIKNMRGVTISSENFEAEVSTLAVGSGHQAYLINGIYKTRAADSVEEKNKWLKEKEKAELKIKEVEALDNLKSDKKKEAMTSYQFAITELAKAYRHLLLSFLRLGLIEQATKTLYELESYLKENERSYRDAQELKAWIEEFKAYQTALGLLERAAVKPHKKLVLLERALKELGYAKSKFQILRFEDYLLEIRTLEQDVKDQIKKIKEKDKKQ